MTINYKSAGVDVSALSKSHLKIGEIITQSYNSQKISKVLQGFGHYAGIVKVNGLTLATHTDGVGTKVIIANMLKKYNTIGIDCVAMNVNDVICIGATPISFVDYIAVNKNDRRNLLKIVSGLVVGAKQGMVPIVGGETAVMPDLITGKGFSFDLAGTVVGLLKHKTILGKSIRVGDVIIGAQSSGLHSNGFSLARKVLLNKFSLNENIRGVGNLGKTLLEPTRIYVKPILEMLDKINVHGLAHITGGSFTKLLRLKKIGYDLYDISNIPPIMRLIQDQGVSKLDMYKTFNMGIGFCVIVPKTEEDNVSRIFKTSKIQSHTIGKIISKTGVFINSRRIA